MLVRSAMQTRTVTISAQKTLPQAVTMMQAIGVRRLMKAETGVHPRGEVSDKLGYRPCPITSNPVISNPDISSLDAGQSLCWKRVLETSFTLETR